MLVRVQNSSLLLLRQSPSNAGKQYMSRLLSMKTMKQQTMKTKTTARNCPIVGLAASVLHSGMKYLVAILCVALMGCATTQTTDPTATKGGPSGDWSRHGLTH
jgi:hypothetical protein